VFHGKAILAHEIIMNIAVFMPIGFLAAIAMRKATWKKVALVGLAISLTIELLQLVLERGYCETDDVINNMLGCLIGYGMVRLRVSG
jgi:glycopeptide antibiotics resistance protein